MPRKSPLLAFVVPEELLERIDEFHHQNRFPSRAAAIKWLITTALEQGLEPAKKSK